MIKTYAPDFSKPCFLYRFEIYIPILDNDGEIIDPIHLKELNQKLLNTFGGVSLNMPYGGSGGIDGMYYSSISEVVYRDKSAVVMVLSKNDEECVSFFKKNLPKWQKKFKQEKILIMMTSAQAF